MPTTSHLPRCLSCLAKPKQYNLLLVGIVWLATAIGSLSAEEPVLRLVGPADRTQLRSTDEARTPMFVQPPALVEHLVSSPTNPFQRAANQWLAKIGSPALDQQANQAAASDFSSAFDPQVEPVAQVEVIADGGSDDDDGNLRCYVSKPLAELITEIGLPQGKLPANAAALCAGTVATVGDRRQDFGWAATDYHWSATNMHHRPLYFEDENLERHGYTPSSTFQPIISGIRFFCTIPTLPYRMAIDPPRSCVYTLGYYRPGSCAPRRWHRLPLRAGASVIEASVVVGLIFLLP